MYLPAYANRAVMRVLFTPVERARANNLQNRYARMPINVCELHRRNASG
jgi:hypothetical protein